MGGKLMTEGTPWKVIVKFALPILFGILLQQLYSTVDMIVVGNFTGEIALSAVGTTGSLTLFFLALANGFSTGVGVLIAQLFGAQEEHRLRENASTGILLLLGMGAISTFVGIAFCGVVLKNILAVPPELYDMAVIYFRIYSMGLIFQFGYNIIASILRSLGDSQATMYFLLIASLLHVVLALVFVVVFNWGVAGAAFATGIAEAASCAAAFVYMNRKYPIFRFRLAEWDFNFLIAKRIIQTGFPMVLQQMIVSFGFFFIQRAVNSYGPAMTASFTVGQRIETYLTMPANAFQITLATYTGQNIGAGNIERVTKGARQTILLSALTTACISAAVFTFARQIINLFGVSDQVAIYCMQHIQTTAIVVMIIAVYFPLLGLFQGAGDGLTATFVATGVLTIRVLATYTLNYLPLFDYRIVWWNQLFGFIGGFIITWTFYLRGNWNRKNEPLTADYQEAIEG